MDEPTVAVAPAATPASPVATSGPDDEDAPVRRESKRLRDKAPPSAAAAAATGGPPAPVLVNLPPHPPRENSTPLHFSTKHYPASAHGERRQQHTHFPRLPPDHAPGPLPDGASASFSYRGPPQPPVPGAAPPVPPPPGGTPLVLDRERPAPAPEFEYSSQQAVLANMLSQRIDQVDQLRTQLAHAEARIASLSARSNPSAALAQAESRAEQAEARLAAIKEAWRGVESYLDMLARREAEARAAFVRTLGTGEIGVPPSVPMFGGAAPTSPYLPVRPPVPPNVPTRAGPTFPALPPAPVPGGNSVIWRHESGRRRPAEDTDEAPNKRPRAERDRRGRDREREREVRKEKARFSDSPSPPPSKKDKEADLSPPIASITDKDADADADGDPDEEVDQIVDDVEMATPTATTNTTNTTTTHTTTAKKPPATTDEGDKDAEGSPETDTDLSVDEELLKLSSKTKKPRREREYAEVDREFARTDYGGYAPHPEYARYHPWGYDPYYHPDEYREPMPRGYPPPPRAEFAQRNGSAPASTSAPWYAHLKQGPAANTNTQGQRTCRQCGLPGRYKDGKCVEKWGPGPEGPGTVCDRCRKKMKRVERRGTADASVLAQGLAMHHPPQSQTTQSTQSQISQTQLGTQYSPQRWQNGNGNAKAYENGNGNADGKRYDVLPKDYAGRREGSVEGKGAANKKEVVSAEGDKDAEGETA
ncbi:unnamed protein product [Rhizoctonia solani]|uniref:Uncharacterized protein n=1 Tax=Rhizoctonia solani TaxID=456999 RepID=A0A8H3HEW0_9AGAM|nr:unnamed protein product [Rhizoctonia solani]